MEHYGMELKAKRTSGGGRNLWKNKVPVVLPFYHIGLPLIPVGESFLNDS
jgi:hypothetical protein